MPYEAKTDWKYDDLVTEKDMNRIEQGLKDAHVPAHQPLTLNPGLQVVEVENDTPFRMGEVKGRTLMNLPGREGNFDYRTSPLFTFFGTGEIIPASTPIGTKVQKIVCNRAADSPGHFGARYELNIDRSKHYVAVAYLENISCDEPVYFSFAEWKSTGYYTIRKSGNVKKGEGMQYRYIDISPDRLETKEKLVFYFRGEGTAGAEFRIGALGLYEISQSEYEAIGSMKFAQVAERYPYVDSMTNVKNPYAIVTGGNLLPPFYDGWAYNVDNGSTFSTTGPYVLTLDAKANNQQAYCDISVVSNTTYFIGLEQGKYAVVGTSEGTPIIVDWTSEAKTFNSGNETLLRVYLGNYQDGTGTFTFKNPMLTVGSEPKPFTPQQRSTLAFETELAAHPVDGSSPDTLFMGDDGLPYVLEPWKKVVLDGGLEWRFAERFNGFKTVLAYGATVGAVAGSGMCTKYDGKKLGIAGNWVTDGPDNINGDIHLGSIYISVANTDSGWGPDYNPETDEIKAYFLGWRMYDTSTTAYNEPYNRTDGAYKGWVRRNDAGNPVDATGNMPTTQAPINAAWQPYRLQYLKAKPTVEPVRNYEMGATLSAGSNMVEVGSGIVIREKANPVQSGDLAWFINAGTALPTSRLEHKVSRWFETYRNNARDPGFNTGFEENYGVQAGCDNYNFDPTAVYHVTYTMLDPTLAAPFNGTVAANLRGTVSDLVRAVNLLESEISVIDAPVKSVNGKTGDVALTADDVGAATKAEFNDLKTTVALSRGYVTPGTDLNSLVTPGTYRLGSAKDYKNIPPGLDWTVLDVIAPYGPNVSSYIVQMIYGVLGDAVYKRTRTETAWGAWVKVPNQKDIDDLKQSVVNGKSTVAGAINDKGGTPVTVDSSFSEMAAAIRSIQGASGVVGLTKEFFNNFTGDFSGPRPRDAISGTFHFNRDGNAVGIAVSTKSEYNYDHVLREISPSGTRVSQQTIESGSWMYDTFRGGVGLAKPGKYAYAFRSTSTTPMRVRIRNSSGTLISDVQPPNSVILIYVFDITEIGGTCYLSASEWFGDSIHRAVIYDSNFNKVFTSAGIQSNSSNFKGGYFIEPSTALYSANGVVSCIRWTLAGGWQEVETNDISSYSYTQLLAAYAYRQ
ncbi:pyocin knob domain-containing protein [Paenibacillus dendritiformis]|uniref:pyocin knob domain-containing protein n=1 Tax=Paenibacillus dendritiformis TaxID=130049 RepID=UPI00365014F1